MRRAAKVDANQSAIIGALKACGCEVQSLAAVGDGVADLLVFHRARRRLFLVECKDGDKPPSARKLTPDQVEWHKRWPVVVVNSIEEAVVAVAGDAVPKTREFCCEAQWREAKVLAWKERDINCDCDHNEYCERCYPIDFRAGGKWDKYK